MPSVASTTTLSTVGTGMPSNFRTVAENFGAITGLNIKKADPSRYSQPSDWRNILDKYEGRALELQTEYYTAEMLNEQGAKFLAVVAPIMPMVEKHIQINKRELYMLPYDITAVGGVPRRTMGRQEVRVQSLQHYERYQSIELNYMMDENFGREALNETLGLLVSQGRLTLYVQASLAIVAVAVEQSFKRFANDFRSARLIHDDTTFFALGNANIDDLCHKLESRRDPLRRFNLILIAESQCSAIKEISTEARTVMGYHYGYDQATERLVEGIFEADRAIATVQTSDGDVINFLANPNFRYSTEISDPEPTQTLYGFSTLCEFVPDVDNDPNQDYDNTVPADPVVHDQTHLRIVHLPLSHVNALAACGIWNDKSGHLHTGPGQFGDALKAVIDRYNKDGGGGAANYFTDKKFQDNDTPPTTAYGKSLRQMPDHRDRTAWMTVIRDGRVDLPHLILSLPERSLPTIYLEKAARRIIKQAKADGETAYGDVFMKRFFPDGGEGHWVGINEVEDEDEEEVVPADELETMAPSVFASSSVSALDPVAFVRHLRDNNVPLKASLDKALSFVPDSHFATFVEIAQFASAEIASNPANQSAIGQGIDFLVKNLKETNGKTSSRDVIDAAYAHAKAGKSFAGLTKAKLLTSKSKAAEQPLNASELNTASALRAHMETRNDDAMDIDTGFGAKKHLFGYKKYDADYQLSLTLKMRLDAVNANHHYDPETKKVMRMIGTAYFSYNNVLCLVKHWGIRLFRFNYWRPFQRYRMSSAVGMVAGPSTMVTGFSSPIVSPGMQHMEGYINVVAQFFSAAIVREPDNFVHFPNIFCSRILADINVRFVKSTVDLRAVGSHKPSVVAEPVPLDERNYESPMHYMNHDVANNRDSQAHSPLSKHSGADLMIEFADLEWLTRLDNANVNGDMYMASPMSLIGHRGWSLRPQKNGTYTSMPGTGPRGEANRNEASFAAKVWSGDSIRFTQHPTFTVPVV